jgi:hypothetical protein
MLEYAGRGRLAHLRLVRPCLRRHLSPEIRRGELVRRGPDLAPGVRQGPRRRELQTTGLPKSSVDAHGMGLVGFENPRLAGSSCLAIVASRERWLSGRKRRFAKPLDGVTRLGGSNPPLSAHSRLEPSQHAKSLDTGGFGRVPFGTLSISISPGADRPRPDASPDCYPKCYPRAARDAEPDRSHRALRPTARGGQGWHRGNGRGICPFPRGFSKPSEYMKPPSDTEMGEAMTR